MKTKNKYLSFGTLLLIILIVIVQVADNFSGILILPLSRFVYYGLTMSSGIQVISRIVFVIGLFLILVSVIRFGYSKRFSLSRLHLNRLQTSEGNNIVYLAGQVLGAKKNLVNRIPDKDSIQQNKQDNEHGIVMISSGCIVFANKAFFKITGYQPLDVFGYDFASLIEHDSLINYTMLSRMSADEIKLVKGIKIITKNKSHVVASLGAGSEHKFDPEGTNVFYLKQAEEANICNVKLNSIFFDSIEQVSALHWIWDEKGIIYLNNSCRNSLPFPLGKIISKPGLMLKLVRKEDRDAVRTSFKEYLNTGKFSAELACILPNGEEKYYRVNISAQPENLTFQSRNHAIAYDITNEKVSLQHALSAALDAELANKNKTAFLANMSHEIRSPLNGIIGFSELLADKGLTDGERERYLSIIRSNGNALISLLTDLIDISKLESGKLVLTNYKFVPAKLLEELKYQFEDSANGKDGVQVTFTDNNSFKNQEISSDPNRLRQILVNLISNAIKFTSKGKIEIGADFTGEEMLFWVKDTGIGIPYENHQHIFERFRQVDSPGSSPVLGFGLGLAISKALVELLGGRLWVESCPDQGSLFIFTIKTNIVNKTMETTQINNQSSYPFDFREHTILIAEDIDFSFLYIEAVLRRTGVKILWAQNGREAIEHVKTNHDIDLILMDMHMPVMNGYEAAEIISKLVPGVPIISQTAFVLPEDMKKCYAAGCSGYLAKPIRKEQLLNTLSEYFENMQPQTVNAPLYRVGIG